MRILGIDYGTKRIGLAISDELGCIAQALEFVEAAKLQQIADLVRERGVTRILVGLPRNLDGTYGPAAEATHRFIEKLKALVTVPIVTWDERLTTVQANRVLIEGNVRRDKRKLKIDSLAAQLLLQSYLDAHPPSDA